MGQIGFGSKFEKYVSVPLMDVFWGCEILVQQQEQPQEVSAICVIRAKK